MISDLTEKKKTMYNFLHVYYSSFEERLIKLRAFVWYSISIELQ